MLHISFALAIIETFKDRKPITAVLSLFSTLWSVVFLYKVIIDRKLLEKGLRKYFVKKFTEKIFQKFACYTCDAHYFKGKFNA